PDIFIKHSFGIGTASNDMHKIDHRSDPRCGAGKGSKISSIDSDRGASIFLPPIPEPMSLTLSLLSMEERRTVNAFRTNAHS
ncbi:MAG: hypothetical protein ACPHY9_02300, partial [Candidatus Puniceispirillaceae bacterium]